MSRVKHRERVPREQGRVRYVATAVVLSLIWLEAPAGTAGAQQAPLGRPAAKCQAIIQKAGLTFVSKKLANLDKCANGILKCIQTKADGPEQQACIVKAGQKCAQPNAGAFAKIVAEEGKLIAAIRKSCEVEGLGPDDLRRIDGLGFDNRTADCPSMATVQDIATCIAAQHECRAEQLFQVQEPRARELIEEAVNAAGLTVPPLTCLPHLGDGENLDDPKGAGKLVAQCESTIKKAGTKFVGKRLQVLQKCVGASFVCVQTKEGVDRHKCLAKASATCAKGFSKLLGVANKVRLSVDKKCLPDPGDFPDFYETVLGIADGANLAAPIAECALVDADPTTYVGYKDCLVDQHEARADDLLRFQVPRTDELLALVGCELESLACQFPAGVLLEGDPDDPAADAMFDLPPVPAADADVVNGVTLTRLDVAITADATVGEVNAALEAVRGLIVGMVDGLPVMTVGVPRQESPEALEALAATLQAMPGILLALPGRDVVPAVAPPPPADAVAVFAYLQDTRFPAAWNARELAGSCTNKITMIVADHFRRPPDALYAQFPTQVPGVTDLGGGSVEDFIRGKHGYDVLTTLAAKLDATVPTGANPFPECLDLKALQIGTLRDEFQVIFAIDQALPPTGKVIVNASYSTFECADPCTLQSLNPTRAVQRATFAIVQRASLNAVANRVLVMSAAGNFGSDEIAGLYLGNQAAEFNSNMNIAATADSLMTFVSDSALWEPTSNCPPEPCLPSLTATPEEEAVLEGLLEAAGQTMAPPAGNVMIVGSTDGVDVSDFSESGADVLAVGEAIPTLLGTPTQGTSFAAPQVAALAAYMWMLSPELRGRPVADTIAAIKANVEAVFPIGQIDAYATVLSLDEAVPVTPTTAPVRLAILDVDNDDDFDLADLQLFHDAYVDELGNVIEPSVRDFSRHDLNGDGFSGGSGSTSRMDLDPAGSTQFGARVLTNVTIEVAGEERTFNELVVSDLDALCYYANSDLYTGSPAQRDALLADLGCGISPLPVFAGTVTETFESMGDGVTVSSTETYTARLEYRADGGITTRGSASLLLSLEEECQPGNLRNLIDASTSDRIRDEGDADSFQLLIEADVEGSNTETGTGSCEEDFVQPFEGTIRTDLLSTPEFVGNQVAALVWDAEIQDAEFTDPFGNVYQGILRMTGRLERVN